MLFDFSSFMNDRDASSVRQSDFIDEQRSYKFVVNDVYSKCQCNHIIKIISELIL